MEKYFLDFIVISRKLKGFIRAGFTFQFKGWNVLSGLDSVDHPLEGFEPRD